MKKTFLISALAISSFTSGCMSPEMLAARYGDDVVKCTYFDGDSKNSALSPSDEKSYQNYIHSELDSVLSKRGLENCGCNNPGDLIFKPTQGLETNRLFVGTKRGGKYFQLPEDAVQNATAVRKTKTKTQIITSSGIYRLNVSSSTRENQPNSGVMEYRSFLDIYRLYGKSAKGYPWFQ